MIEVRSIWEDLMREDTSRTVHHSIPELQRIRCVLGYTPQTKTRFLQLDIPSKMASRSFQRRTQAVLLEQVTLGDGNEVLLLVLQEPGLTDVFSLFVDDVLHHLQQAEDAAHAATLLQTRFEHWQQLFAKLSSDLISLEIQRGLYGELVILRQLLDHHSNHPAIWDCWRGPYSDNHDFSMNGVALEVKSSVASSPIMHISNELQLDMTGWTVLVLCLVHLNEARGSDRTLSSLIHELIERGAGRPAIQQTFRSKLGKIGVEQRHYELFTELGYEVRSTSFYGVTDGFPSIRRSSLSNSVKKVTYELIPAGVDSFQIDRGSAMNHFLPS